MSGSLSLSETSGWILQWQGAFLPFFSPSFLKQTNQFHFPFTNLSLPPPPKVCPHRPKFLCSLYASQIVRGQKLHCVCYIVTALSFLTTRIRNSFVISKWFFSLLPCPHYPTAFSVCVLERNTFIVCLKMSRNILIFGGCLRWLGQLGVNSSFPAGGDKFWVLPRSKGLEITGTLLLEGRELPQFEPVTSISVFWVQVHVLKWAERFSCTRNNASSYNIIKCGDQGQHKYHVVQIVVVVLFYFVSSGRMWEAILFVLMCLEPSIQRARTSLLTGRVKMG